MSNIKFYRNPSSGIRVVPCGRTDRQMTKLIVAFRNFANAPDKKFIGFIIGMFVGCVKRNCIWTECELLPLGLDFNAI
jgi:hypothetical protein